MSVGEREKGHEWIHWAYDYLRGYCACGECGSEKMMVHIGEWKEHISTAHPSAGQSDASLPAESLARAFHEAYERLAPSFGYETRKASAKPWEQVPEQNRKLMIAVCNEVMVPRLAESRAEIAKLREELVKAGNHIGELDEMVQLERAAMREECAKLAESWTNADGSNEPTTSAIAGEIRSLPADSSALDARAELVNLKKAHIRVQEERNEALAALDARDARVRLELSSLVERWRLRAAPDVRSRRTTPVTLAQRKCADELEEALAQRSAEKGKGE